MPAGFYLQNGSQRARRDVQGVGKRVKGLAGNFFGMAPGGGEQDKGRGKRDNTDGGYVRHAEAPVYGCHQKRPWQPEA